MPFDQWLRATAEVDGVLYPYWYNTAAIDDQGRPIRSWICPTLLHESATNSAMQNHQTALGRVREPDSSNVTLTEVPQPTCCVPGKTLQLASKELERVFNAVYLGTGDARSIFVTFMIAFQALIL